MSQRAQLVLAKNLETQAIVEKAGARRARFYLDCGLPPGYVKDDIEPAPQGDVFKMIWGGRLEKRKSLALGLDALAKVKVPVKLLVAGEEVTLREGEVLHIAPGVPHQVEALDDTFVLGMFSPVRRDWVE